MDHKIIASIMTDISENIVWPIIHEICKDHNKKVVNPFSARIGSGARTYHTLKRQNGKKQHIVTYGQKMLEDKRDYNRAVQWLTGREIIEKDFFNGVATYENIVAHTILHEMAHALQVIMGDRTYNSVHNKAFYQWLKLLHNKCGHEVLNALINKSQKKKVSLDFKINEIEENNPTPIINARVGKIYQCYLNKQNALVKLTKINPKKFAIIVIDEKHKENGKSYSIPKHMLDKAPEEFIKNRIDLNVINDAPLDTNQIKILKKYKIELMKRTLVVEVKKKNRTTAIVEILSGNDGMIGQKWKIPLSNLKENN